MMNNEGRATSLAARLEHVYLFNFNFCGFVLVGDGVDLDLDFEDEVVSKNNTKLFNWISCFFKKRLFIWYLFLF